MPTNPNSTGSTTPFDRGTEAGLAAPDLAGDATALLDEAKSAAGKVADEAMEQVASLTDRAMAELGDATEKAKSMAAEQKDMFAQHISGLAESLTRAAGDLEQTNGSGAQYARMIADNAGKLSDTIRNNDVDQLLGMAQDFGRRQPAVFMGAAALLGFAASRFVLASARRRDEQAMAKASQGYDSGYSEYAGEPASSFAGDSNPSFDSDPNRGGI